MYQLFKTFQVLTLEIGKREIPKILNPKISLAGLISSPQKYPSGRVRLRSYVTFKQSSCLFFNRERLLSFRRSLLTRLLIWISEQPRFEKPAKIRGGINNEWKVDGGVPASWNWRDGQRTCAKNTEKWREIEYASETHKEYALIIHTTIKLLSQRLVATDLSSSAPTARRKKMLISQDSAL